MKIIENSFYYFEFILMKVLKSSLFHFEQDFKLIEQSI